MQKQAQKLIHSFSAQIICAGLAFFNFSFATGATATQPPKNRIVVQISKSESSGKYSILTKNQKAQSGKSMTVAALGSTASGTSVAPLAATSSAKKEKPWAIQLGLDRSSNMVASNEPESEVSTSLAIAPSYKLNNRFGIGGNVAIERVESGSAKGDTKTTDPAVALTVQGWKLTEQLSTSHIFTGIIPGNVDSIQRDRFKGALAIGNRLTLSAPYGVYSYTLGLRQNSHEFTVNADRTPNIERTLSHRISTATPIYGPVSLVSDLSYRDSWTYEGFQRSGFSFSIGMDYAATKALSFNLGMTNAGSALKANGQDSNIELYNERTNVISLGVGYVL